MNRDITLEKIPKGESPYILNANPSEDYGTITNEIGNTLEVSVPNGYNIIGTCLLDDNRQVLFCVNGTLSAIYVKDKDSLETVIPPSSLLGFSIEHQIEAIFKRNYKGDYIIYWTDNYNKPRWFNITSPITLTTDNIVTIDMFSSYERPVFTLDKVTIGGSLLSGVYQFFLQYVDSYGNVTDYIGASDIVSVTPSTNDSKPYKYSGAPAGTKTSKKIVISLDNLDTSYVRFNVVSLFYNDGVLGVPKQFISQAINGTEATIEYTGNEISEDVALANVLSLYAKYQTAKTIISFDKTLYLGNLTSNLDLGLQKYVNSITVDYELHNTNIANNNTSFNNEVVIYSNRGFMQDDVYALYIAYILNDGSLTKAYHIPGRQAENINKYRISGTNLLENSLVSDVKSGLTYPGQRTIPNNVLDEAIALNVNAKWFQFFGTEDNSNSTSNLGYWENQNEIYPSTSDWDIYTVDVGGAPVSLGTLQGSKVRHHRMPEPEIKNNADTKYLTTSPGTFANIIGLRIKNIPIPASVRSKIAGFKIFYAKKDQSNSLVLGQDVAKFNAVQPIDGITKLDKDRVWLSLGANHIKVDISSGHGTYDFIDSTSFRLHDFNCITNDLDISGAAWIKYLGMFTTVRNIYIHANVGGQAPAFSSDYTGIVMSEYVTNPTWVASIDGTYKARDTEYIRRIKSCFYLEPTIIPGAYAGTKDVYNTTRNIYNYKGEKSIFVEVYNEYSRTPYVYNTTRVQAPLLILMSYREDVHSSFDQQELVECYSDAAPGGFFKYNESVRRGDTFFGINTYRVAEDITNVPTNTGASGFIITEFRDGYIVPYLSRSNSLFRHIGELVTDIYYPKVGFVTGDALAGQPNTINLPGTGVLEYALTFDNYWGYNKDYSRGNNIIQPDIFQKNLTADADTYLTRILRSNKQSEESIDDAFRQFPVNNYVDLDRDRGQIEVIKKDNNSLIVVLTNSITKTLASQVLKTDSTNAFIGNGDIFAIPNREIRYSDIGYGGTQSQWAGIITPYGYIYPDIKNSKIMLLSDSLSPISDNGMINFCQDSMPSSLLEQFPGINIIKDNPANPNGIGYTSTWDNDNRRYIITKRDYEMRDRFFQSYIGEYDSYPSASMGDIIWYTPEKRFKNFAFPGIWVTLGFYDTIAGVSWFIDKSFTMAYYPELKSWFSFYSYVPLLYTYDQKDFWSIKDNGIWKHGIGDRCNFYGTIYRSIIDIPFNDAGNKSKIFDSVQYVSKYNINGVDYNKTFDKYNIYGSSGLSGETSIINNETARLVNGTWNINSFRDLRSDYTTKMFDGLDLIATANLNKLDMLKKRFFDNYVVARLIHENNDNAKISLTFNSTKARVKER